MTLNEIARRLGVETRHKDDCDCDLCEGAQPYHRPALAIAHDVLRKLPYGDWVLQFHGELGWRVEFAGESGIDTGAFEQAVVALAERYLETKP